MRSSGNTGICLRRNSAGLHRPQVQFLREEGEGFHAADTVSDGVEAGREHGDAGFLSGGRHDYAGASAFCRDPHFDVEGAGLLVKSAAGDQRPDGVACFRRDQLPFCHRIKAVRSKDRAEAADFPGIVQTGVLQKASGTCSRQYASMTALEML